MKRVFITTTDAIENAKILEYKGTVLSTIVAGTGFLSDFAASLTDFFGGRSGTYKRQMERIYSEALDDISSQANHYKANAVIGCKIDFSNIPAKGMSMFMIALSGTAVIAEFQKETIPELSEGSISDSLLEGELQKRSILSRLASSWSPTEKEWEEIMKDPSDDYAMPLIHVLLKRLEGDPNLGKFDTKELIRRIGDYLPLIKRPVAVDAVYTLIQNSNSYGFDLIKRNKLFDADSTLKLVDYNRLSLACNLLNVSQPYYSASDLNQMKLLSSRIHNLPEIGSRSTDKYICPDGHSNNRDIEYCRWCGKNIKGLTRENVEALEQFDRSIEALEFLLKDNKE